MTAAAFTIALACGGCVAGMFDGEFTYAFPSDAAQAEFRRQCAEAGVRTVSVQPASTLSDWEINHHTALGRDVDSAGYHEDWERQI